MKTTVYFRQNLIVFLLAIAIALITHFSYLHFNQKWVVYREAEAAYQAQEWQLAIPFYKESLEKGLDHPVAMLRIAESYQKEADYEGSALWYDKYLSVKPADIWARKNYAGVLTALGKFTEASEQYQRIIEEEKKLNESE